MMVYAGSWAQCCLLFSNSNGPNQSIKLIQFHSFCSSYLHCEWASLEQLERDKRIHQKIKRFKTKHAQMSRLFQEVRGNHVWFGWCGPAPLTGAFGLWSCGSLQEEEPFNPDYVEVDRILDVSHSVDKDNGEVGGKTDVCFCLDERLVFSKFTLINYYPPPPFQNVIYYLVKWCSLPYEDATWELNEDVDEGKVEEFRKIQNRQPRLKRTVGNRGVFMHLRYFPHE